MEITEENSDAKEFLQVKNRQPDEDREASKNRFHEFVIPKVRFCTRCHTGEEKSYLLFRTLFFSEQRIYNVTNLNIVGIVENTGNSTCPYYSI